MTVFVDTSALYALIDDRDDRHVAAVEAFAGLSDPGSKLTTHSYVMAETISLLQRRIGIVAVRRLLAAIVPVIEIAWVDGDLHERAVSSLLAADRRGVSIVDHVSFALMRDRGIRNAFAFDVDFASQGFELIPA